MHAEPVKADGGKPWWLGVLVLALGGLCLYGASDLQQTATYAAVGPGLAVSLAGGGLMLLGLALLVQIARGERFEPQDSEGVDSSKPADRRALATAFVAVLLPVLAIPVLGVPVTATVAFALVARSFGSRKLVGDLVLGAVLGSAAWLLFSKLGMQLGGFLPLAGF